VGVCKWEFVSGSLHGSLRAGHIPQSPLPKTHVFLA